MIESSSVCSNHCACREDSNPCVTLGHRYQNGVEPATPEEWWRGATTEGDSPFCGCRQKGVDRRSGPHTCPTREEPGEPTAYFARHILLTCEAESRG